MSVRVMTWVFERSRSKKNARLVLLAIADCANDEGKQAYPSMAKLQQKTGLGERSVTNLVAELEELGELEVERNGGPKGCNLYRVVMTPAENAPPQKMHPAKSAPRRKRQSPPQKTTVTPAESAPGTIKEPSKNHPSETEADATLPFDVPLPDPPPSKPPAHWSDHPDFVTWYDAYVRKTAAPEAYKAWLKVIANPKGPGLQRLLELTQRFTSAFIASGKEKKYAKGPAPWLNQECWNDDLPEPPSQQRASPPAADSAWNQPFPTGRKNRKP